MEIFRLLEHFCVSFSRSLQEEAEEPWYEV